MPRDRFLGVVQAYSQASRVACNLDAAALSELVGKASQSVLPAAASSRVGSRCGVPISERALSGRGSPERDWHSSRHKQAAPESSMMLHCSKLEEHLNNDFISRTIERALTSAGLRTNSGPTEGLLATIQQALHRARTRADAPPAPARPPKASSVDEDGAFLTCSHAGARGPRGYKLFVPYADVGRPAPLIVMLHGCKQDPDDFAAGTRMNEIAQREGCFVAYPEQGARQNGANCWTWYEPWQQARGGDEPSDIAGIVRDIGASYDIDASRVFVAGLSAGAAMAVVLGAAYPDIFSAVGAHSGLPMGAARDVPSAVAAMRGTRGAVNPIGRLPAIPTLVIHGDADATVAPSNGAAIAEQALLAHAAAGVKLRQIDTPALTINGKRCTTTRHVDEGGRSRVEEWVVKGGSHTWFGGSTEGSYTDRSGPDASEEMVRFFLANTATA